MRLAAIDIGTNSTRLLIVEKQDGLLRVMRQELLTTRLGQGVGQSRKLLPEAQERTARAVQDFCAVARDMGCSYVRVFATSAVRDAVNRAEFLDRVEKRIAIRPEVLSGETEARLSYLGATRALQIEDPTLVVDVGGGSTELIWGEGDDVAAVWSLNIGAVRLTEACLKEDPPTAEELMQLEHNILVALTPVVPPWPGAETQAVAVGGTATTLAALVQGLAEYRPNKVQGFFLSAAKVKDVAVHLAQLPVAVRKELPGVPAARADIIAAGAAILALVAKHLGLKGYVVSDADLLLGSLYAGTRTSAATAE